MKYNVGDRVQIKSLDWYNDNKDEHGYVPCREYDFVPEMLEFCGKILTIDVDFEDETYLMKEDNDGFVFTSEMIERLVERNGKIYPYNIGDRVVLKGNHRHATITDLKYNSFGNLSYYVKIDNDKDVSVDIYDNMIEGLAKETKPKFKVGDRVITNKGYIGKFEGWVSDYQVRVLFEESGCNVVIHPKDLKLAEDEMSLDKAGQITDFEYDGLAYTLPDGYQFVDENGNEILTSKIILKKKKKEYPKTYEECLNVLGYEDIATHCIFHTEAAEKLFNALYDLKVCRDAYWKIAGDEMGLGKPWEPDWREERYIIYRNQNDIIGGYREAGCAEHHIFEFPTLEMRDAFKENFDPDIEICKEFL